MTGPVPDPVPAPLSARDVLQALFFLLLVRPFLMLFVGLRVHGREHLPRTDPFILVANHSSHLDAVSLLSLFPLRRLRRIRPVAAADYFERNRVIAAFSRTCFNILPIARHGITADNDPRPRMLEALRRGDSLVLFPEGTRGSGQSLAHFKSGVAWLAQHAPEAPIVPALLVNLGRCLPKGELIPVPLFAEVRIGPPRHPSGSQEEILAELEQAVRCLGETSTPPPTPLPGGRAGELTAVG
jgi:1-acyl-sn-glycerol-3-phosphate acyltransferase